MMVVFTGTTVERNDFADVTDRIALMLRAENTLTGDRTALLMAKVEDELAGSNEVAWDAFFMAARLTCDMREWDREDSRFEAIPYTTEARDAALEWAGIE